MSERANRAIEGVNNSNLAQQTETVVVMGITLLSKDAIKADQDVIKGALTKLDGAIHSNAVQCLLHAQEHGDTSLMRRLLVDIIDAKTGYRRQGLINWLRKFSPMELKGDNINLSGVLTAEGAVSLKKQFVDIDPTVLKVGQRRPFLPMEANKTPFWTDKDNNEQVAKAIYKDGIFSKFNTGMKEFRAAWANTLDGKPIDPTKPYYDGIGGAQIFDFMEIMEKQVAELPVDNTRAIRKAQSDLRTAIGDDKEYAKSVVESVKAEQAA